MDGIEVIDTGRGWGVLETAASGFIRFVEDSPVELFSNAPRAWGLAIYATEVYGSVRAAEHRIPAWALDTLPPLDTVMERAGKNTEEAGRLYAEELHRAIGEFDRVRDLVLSDAEAQRRPLLPSPLIGARQDTAVALWYDANGPARVTRDRIDRALRLAQGLGFARVVMYGSSVRDRPKRGAPWRFVAVHEAERANTVRERERGQIVMDVARQLPGFRYLGSQFSYVLVGQDDRGAVGVIWRETDEEISREDWEIAAVEAHRLGTGPGLTLIGTGNAATLDEGWRFIQVAQRGGKWVAVSGLETTGQE